MALLLVSITLSISRTTIRLQRTHQPFSNINHLTVATSIIRTSHRFSYWILLTLALVVLPVDCSSNRQITQSCRWQQRLCLFRHHHVFSNHSHCIRLSQLMAACLYPRLLPDSAVTHYSTSLLAIVTRSASLSWLVDRSWRCKRR